MQLSSLQVSNIFSFPPLPDSVAPTVEFELINGKRIAHFIGPNGSGKSNLIEILNQIFGRVFFRVTQVNDDILQALSKGAPLNNPIFQEPQNDARKLNGLEPHWAAPGGDQWVKLGIAFSSTDYDNLRFIVRNSVELNALFSRYRAGISLPNVSEDQIASLATQEYVLKWTGNATPTPVPLDKTAGGSLALLYLRDFDLLQNTIRLRNDYDLPAGETHWRPLGVNFAVLGPHRNYASFNQTTQTGNTRLRSLSEVTQGERQLSTRSVSSEEPKLFELVRRRLAFDLMERVHDRGYQEAIAWLAKQDTLAGINAALATYLGLEFTLSRRSKFDNVVHFGFQRLSDRRSIHPHQLSSGERAILHLILLIYGADMRGGMILIDEPELHLHPQMQRKFSRIMRDASKDRHVQFVTATHSPVFVEADDVDSICRFRIKDSKTSVMRLRVTSDEKNLARAIQLDNASRIYFVNRVVLVEGETDAMFFRRLLQKISSSKASDHAWNVAANDVEFMSIQGKGERSVWTTMLEKFGLQVVFIGDQDNVVEFGLVDPSKAATSSRLTASLGAKGSRDGQRLIEVIDAVSANPSAENIQELRSFGEYLRARHSKAGEYVASVRKVGGADWAAMLAGIRALRGKGVYLLEEGELEDYLGIDEKGLDRMMAFCQRDFEGWYDNATKAREYLVAMIEEIVTRA